MTAERAVVNDVPLDSVRGPITRSLTGGILVDVVVSFRWIQLPDPTIETWRLWGTARAWSLQEHLAMVAFHDPRTGGQFLQWMNFEHLTTIPDDQISNRAPQELLSSTTGEDAHRQHLQP